MEELGKRIRSQRERRKLKQSDISSALQVSPQAVSKWERGENAPDIALLAPLSRLLGVSVEWLLGAYAEEPDVFDATVLAVGARTARAMSEALSPREFAAWANGLCTQLTETVIGHDGVPVKYSGPGLLAFFAGADHARRAVAAALSARNVAAAPVKAGISGGRIFLGPIGHPDYAQPDIMGEAVSIALLAVDWAAEHAASGIALSLETAEAVAGSVALSAQRKVCFPGISREVRLCEVKCAAHTPGRRRKAK